MATEAQTCARESGYPWFVLNFVFWSFEFVSNFGFRASHFTSPSLCLSGFVAMSQLCKT
ncbi:unnamed protein product [marine sediment metagenome]|uniref:Uncharacterized protein n=1 Tax=marine sediment metagenome TaxID=412755 RepID=X1FP30_9ZZZZ